MWAAACDSEPVLSLVMFPKGATCAEDHGWEIKPGFLISALTLTRTRWVSRNHVKTSCAHELGPKIGLVSFPPQIPRGSFFYILCEFEEVQYREFQRARKVENHPAKVSAGLASRSSPGLVLPPQTPGKENQKEGWKLIDLFLDCHNSHSNKYLEKSQFYLKAVSFVREYLPTAFLFNWQRRKELYS